MGGVQHRGLTFGPRRWYGALGPAHQSCNERDDEQNDCDPEQKPGAVHGCPGDTAETEKRRDQRNDEKDDCVMQ